MRKIRGFPYLINENGKVIKLIRVIRNRAGALTYHPAKPLKPNLHNPRKYHRVTLYNGDIRKHLHVHRLVYEAFVGEIPKGYEVDHVDGDKNNNHYSNLEAVTASENVKRAYKLGLMIPKKGKLNGMHKSNRKCHTTELKAAII